MKVNLLHNELAGKEVALNFRATTLDRCLYFDEVVDSF